MEPSLTYNEFRSRSSEPSTSLTISLIERLLNERLNSECGRIRVDYCNTGGVMRFCFTLFRRDGSYTMRFAEVKNFRNWRPDGILNDEIVLIENMISRFTCLSEILTSE